MGQGKRCWEVQAFHKTESCIGWLEEDEWEMGGEELGKGGQTWWTAKSWGWPGSIRLADNYTTNPVTGSFIKKRCKGHWVDTQVKAMLHVPGRLQTQVSTSEHAGVRSHTHSHTHSILMLLNDFLSALKFVLVGGCSAPPSLAAPPLHVIFLQIERVRGGEQRGLHFPESTLLRWYRTRHLTAAYTTLIPDGDTWIQ